MSVRQRARRRRRGQVLESWLLLFSVDVVMRFRGFPVLYDLVREWQIRTVTNESPNALSHAMDLACVFYFKPVLCLQRSASLALLLSRHGWKGEMVIGVQLLPFLSHAWVEVEGAVVNDKPYVREMFQVLERCE
jgi:hypothetical protein